MALETPVHRLDPRAKLAAFAAALLVLFTSPPSVGIVATLFLAAACGIARVPVAHLVSTMRSLIWVFAITFAYQAFWAGPRQFGSVAAGAEVGLHMVLRLVGMMLAVTALLFTTEPLRLADGLAHLLRPLEKLRVPVGDLTLVLTLALRFLPTVMEEAERIVTAQRARGARFEGNLLTRARALLPLAVPLLASCLRRADTLALAMTARGYRPGAPRTRMEPLAFAARDAAVVAGAILLSGGEPRRVSGFVWKLLLEYDGTEFSGWQWQTGLRTVQEELERALSIVMERPVRIAGAGRTDSGVHATGQVGSFPAAAGDLDLDTPDLLFKLNAILAHDVAVRSVDRMPPRFHARFAAIRRHYVYRLLRRKSPLERRSALRVRGPFDIELLRDAASRIPGRRDFASIGAAEPGESTVCHLERLEVVDQGDLVILEVSANRFLRKMVRTLVGALLEVARGRRPPEWIDELLDAKDRRAGSPTVAARGLTLVGVDYRELEELEGEGSE